MANVIKIKPKVTAIIPRKRVAAYARVSMESDRLNHSLSSQISYFSKLIQSNPEWIYAGVYADSGISGGAINRRAEFKRLLNDCNAGKIDIVLCNIKTRYLIQFHTRGKSLQAFVIWALQGFLRFRKLECDGQYLVKEK